MGRHHRLSRGRSAHQGDCHLHGVDWIQEVDINPLLASSQGSVALDSRILLHDPDTTEDKLPRPAILGYPKQYITKWVAKDGTPLTLRPMRPEDEPAMKTFHRTLSERAVYMRYFQMFNIGARTAHERLMRICFIDYDREMALVAVRGDTTGGEGQILGVGRLTKIPGSKEAEFALLVTDQYQNKGLGTELLSRIIDIGRCEKVERITGDILPENGDMRRVCEKVGFKVIEKPEDRLLTAYMKL
jgi:acetyltransferase